MSIDRVTHEPSITDQKQRAATTAQPEPGATKNITPDEAHDIGMDKDGYVVERMVRPIVEGGIICYGVRWYGYGPKDDTVEREHHVPQHFITRYWRHVNKKSK